MPYKDSEKKREANQRYYAANRAKVQAQQRCYREENREKLQEYGNRYHKENSAKKCAHTRRWREENPDKMLAAGNRRRARKRGAVVGDPAEVATREAEIRESRWCEKCKAEVDDLHVDHIQPLSRGGSHSVENLQGLCAKHNLEKGARLPSRVG